MNDIERDAARYRYVRDHLLEVVSYCSGGDSLDALVDEELLPESEKQKLAEQRDQEHRAANEAWRAQFYPKRKRATA